WGFRALVPGITVIDYSPPSTSSTEAETLDLAAGEMATSAAEEHFPDAEIEEEIAATYGDDLVTVEEISSPARSEIVPASPDTVGAINRAPMEENELPDKSNAQLIVRPNLMPTVLPLYGKGRKHVDVKKLARTRRSIHKRWMHNMQDERRRKRFHRLVSTGVVAALLILVLLPLGTGLAAYSAYNSIRGVALDGVNYLLTVKNLIPVSKSDPTAALDPHKLLQARSDLSKAQSDFLQLQQLVNRPDVHSAVDQFVPQYSGELGMVQRLVQVGIDVSRLGDEAIGVALLGANIVHGSPLASGSTKPLITAADIANVEGVLVHGQYYLDDIRAQMSQISVNQLPISAAQQKQFTSLMALLPRVQGLIEQGQGLVGIVSWLLGVGQPRHYLVQTMDNAELRPGGGFTGIYGLLTIHDGRMAPFSLQDVTVLDYASNGTEINRQAPPAYRSWMNFGNFGLRDSNISADYPTSARLNLQIFQEEGGGPVDGDIALTPKVISHILNVIGPIKVPQYNEIITAQNLEDKLHYYQQDFGAIAREKQISGNYSHAGRKAFTSTLGKLLLDRVKHLSVKQLMAIMQGAVKDIQSRDLEIYFTNPLVEGWLVHNGYSGAMNTFSSHDGFMVVQANISISKASQYVHTTYQDNIVLDAQGGATHNLTITLNYQQTGPVYGYDTYADYIRVYAPAGAQLLGGDGFDSGQALCTPAQSSTGEGGTGGLPASIPPPRTSCAQYNVGFPDSSRYCPDGNYSLGLGYVPGKGVMNWPVDSVGGPTQLSSDLPGRAMWGGLTVTPKNCISTITLQWYVPHEVKNVRGQSPYTVLVGKQGGYVPQVQITVDTSAIKGLKPFSYEGNLIADRVFSLPLKK
ncbi:MAG TPA: DUF4012 domain-containing protein, partial [Ktedonobacteraceae bacterium]|nr:DUF4012 domain-containing protein [Ktedonobacteraceae bacterium]